MRKSPATLIRATFGGPRVAALLLSVVCAPTFGASALDPLCDRAAKESASLEVSAEELSVDVVDHDGDVRPDSREAPDDIVSALQPSNPSVDTILRRIFDESRPAFQGTGQSDIDAKAIAAPLAELTAPAIIGMPGDAATGEQPESSSIDEVNQVLPQFPELSDADALRFRQQMFRTDI